MADVRLDPGDIVVNLLWVAAAASMALEIIWRAGT